jgi:hypothetical protein
MSEASSYSAVPHITAPSVKIIKSIGLATLVSGTLDAIAAVVVFNFALGRMSIIQILQWIASGVFGQEAFNMGLAGASYGVLFHFIIAFAFSAGLFLFYKKFAVIRDYPIFSGLAYGGYIWIFMNFIILPRTQLPVSTFEPGVAFVGFVWHMLFVGIPITFIAKKTFDFK